MGECREDEVRRGGPDKGLGLAVVLGDVVADGLVQMRHETETAAANRRRGDLGEPALCLVEPGAVGRNEVRVETRMAHKPATHGGSFVRGTIVEYQTEYRVGGSAHF